MARSGWDVAVHYRDSGADALETVGAIEALGRRALALPCDLADENAVQQLLPEVAARLGPVSCVVNNAALFDYDNAAGFSQARLDAHMHANLAAPILLAQALHAATPDGAQGGGDQSAGPETVQPESGFPVVHAVEGGIAQRHHPAGAGAGAEGARGRHRARHHAGVRRRRSEQGFAAAHRTTPLGRSSTPDDIAAAVCYLAAAPAITGTTLIVDGGQHLLPLPRDVMFLAQ